MHNFTWRLDIDLNGPGDDSVFLTKHVENLRVPPSTTPPSTATDTSHAATSARISVEGSEVWDPERLNTLELFDRTLHNGRGRRTSYELIPMRSGTARHSEPYTKADFWVTRFVGLDRELLAARTNGPSIDDPTPTNDDLPHYIKPPDSTVDRDIVLWYTGSVHHETKPRDEDRDTVPVLWTGFELIPHNLFDRTPFFP